MLARLGTNVDYVVGGAYHLLLVLDHDHRVTQIAQLLQHLYQAVRVARMESDARLVQNV